jgi:hypothetical protein
VGSAPVAMLQRRRPGVQRSDGRAQASKAYRLSAPWRAVSLSLSLSLSAGAKVVFCAWWGPYMGNEAEISYYFQLLSQLISL